MTIDVTIDDAELKAELRKLADKINNLTPFFADVGETLLNSTRERFRSMTDPDGTPWAPLSPAYQAQKPKNKNLILTLNGFLRGTLTKQATRDSLRIGSPLDYAAKHQFGSGRIPARPFLGLSEEDRSDLLDALNEYLAE